MFTVMAVRRSRQPFVLTVVRRWSLSLIAAAVISVLVLAPAATAASGDTVWTASYGVPEQVERGLDSALSPDGSRFYVTGVDDEGPNGDFVTVAYDATTGSQVWASTYDAGQRDEANRVEVAPDGSRVYVVGVSRGEETSADYVTIAYAAATGKELWVARYDGISGRRRDVPSCLAVSGNTVFVTGSSRGDGFWDFASVAYDAATGEERWTARFDRRDSTDFAQGCTVALDGSAFFVTGRNHIGERDAASAVTIAYDSTSGRRIWTDRFDRSRLGWDEATAMTISADGLRVYVVGLSNRGRGSTPDYLTIAYDATSGSVEWHRVDRTDDFSVVLDVAVAADGSTVYVTGESAGNARTVAYATADGTERWHRTYLTRDFGLAESVAVSPDGSTVYVAGWEAFQSFTLAYDTASGDTLWTRNEPASAWGSVTTSADGAFVCVAGIVAVGEDRNVFAAAYEG